jgi:hypothetical protein
LKKWLWKLIWPKTFESTVIASASNTSILLNELAGQRSLLTPFPLNPFLDSEGQYEETEGASEDIEEFYYKEPDLSGGVEGVDYTIPYGISEGTKEEADN